MSLSLPKNWEWRKARDCMDVRDGTHDSPKYIATGYPLVTSKNLVNGEIDFSTCSFISQEDFDAISKRSAVDDGDILYAMIGTIGNPVIVQKQREFAIKNVALFKFNNKSVFNRYVFHFLNSDLAINQFNTNSRGGTQKFVSLTNVRDLKIPVPPLGEQQKIAAILDAADSLRQKDQELVERYTALSQSLFLEMFGDLTTEHKFPVFQTIELIDVRDGTHDSPNYIDNGIPLVTSKNIKNGMLDLNNVNLISEEDYIQIQKRSKVGLGDIIMPMIGTIGNPHLVVVEPDYAIKNVALYKYPDASKVNNIYLFYILNSYYFDRYVSTKNKGGTQKFLSLGDLRKMPFPLAPIELQNQFAERIQLIKAQKQQAQRSLEKSEVLFNSLLQRAFTGELTAKIAA